MLIVKTIIFKALSLSTDSNNLLGQKNGWDMRAALSYFESSLCYGQYDAAHEEVSVERYPETVILKCAAEKEV